MSNSLPQGVATFNACEDLFLRWMPSPPFKRLMQQTVFKEVFERVMQEEKAAIRVLDVGCGHGTWIKWLLESFPDWAQRLHILGVEPSSHRLQQALEFLKPHENVEIQQGTIFDVHEQDWDIIFFIEVFQFFDVHEQHRNVLQMHRLNREGGVAIVVDGSFWTLRSLRHQLGKIYHKFWVPYHSQLQFATFLTYPRFSSLKRIFREVGYHPITLVKEDFRHAIVAQK